MDFFPHLRANSYWSLHLVSHSPVSDFWSFVPFPVPPFGLFVSCSHFPILDFGILFSFPRSDFWYFGCSHLPLLLSYVIPLICPMFLRSVSDSLVMCTSYVASLMFPFVCVHMDLTRVPLRSTSYRTPSFLLFVIHDKPFVFKYLSLYSLTSALTLLLLLLLWLYSLLTSTLTRALPVWLSPFGTQPSQYLCSGVHLNSSISRLCSSFSDPLDLSSDLELVLSGTQTTDQ